MQSPSKSSLYDLHFINPLGQSFVGGNGYQTRTAPLQHSSLVNIPKSVKSTWPEPSIVVQLGSILPTFYEQLLHMQIPKAQKSCLT